MPSIRNTLNALKESGQKALVPYISGGDPSLEGTTALILALEQAGADLLEIGVPFSDPVADGPVNQAAAERALAQGTTLPRLLEALKNTPFQLPVILFTYVNPILQMGLSHFAETAKDAGVAGVLTLDLPLEESQEYQKVMAEKGLETVFLATPTTPLDRLKDMDNAATGCIYYVARMGVTGAATEMKANLFEQLDQVRGALAQPLIVGFGISSPDQVQQLCPHVDGVVVGSALVKRIAQAQDLERAASTAHDYIKALKQATKG